MNSYIITNTNIWNADKVLKNQNIFIENGIVQKISSEPITDSNAKAVDAKGFTIIPSGVDLQVHFRSPGQAHKETPLSGLKTCLQGGVGCVLQMPNTNPVVHTPEVVHRLKKEFEGAFEFTGVKAEISSAVTVHQNHKVTVDFKAMAEAGVKAFTEDGVGIKSDEVFIETLKACAEFNLPLLEHAEIYEHEGVLGAGPTQEKLKIPLYKGSAEWEFVKRDLELLKEVPEAKYHVLHVSTQKTLELVKEAKSKGLKVTCEVTPHHLYFSTQDIPETNTSFKMNPPLQLESDRQALREALKDGTIDFVTTDHAPHESYSKDKSFPECAYGTTGLSTLLGSLIGLYQNGLIDERRLVDVFATAPARFIGVDDEFGTIKEGQPFRAVLIDPQAKARIFQSEDTPSLSKNNIFKGLSLPFPVLAHINEKGFFIFDSRVRLA